MSDESVLSHINELVEEEHRLRRQVSTGEISTEEERARLNRVEEALDQCWDLLRRRRAARDEGGDPERVEARPTQQVEGYLQ